MEIYVIKLLSFGDYIYDNIIYMDLYNENKTKYYPNISQPEIEVKFDGDYGKLIINVHKNETLIREREEIITIIAIIIMKK